MRKALVLLLLCSACSTQKRPFSTLVPPPPAHPATAPPVVQQTTAPVRRIDPLEQEAIYEYRRGKTLVTRREGDLTRYVYTGNAVPIFCRQLYVTDIALEDGEDVSSMSIGDSKRWCVDSTHAGGQPHVSVKPCSDAGDLATNLTIYTDRRVYSFELRANAGKFQPRVGFFYPPETSPRAMGKEF